MREVLNVLRSGWLTTGEKTQRFEEEFRQYTGARHALAVNSCTAGLHLALAGLGVGPGDEVITTPLTFCATVNCIIHVGAVPVLADIREDGNIDPARIAERVTSRTRAVIPVHYSGLPCDMNAIWRLARECGLFVVEDAAHGAGTFHDGVHLGSAAGRGTSSAVAFSFYATKNMTTGEGGMVTTNDAGLHARMRRLSLHGISKDGWNRYRSGGSWYYEVRECGFKYNLSDLQSALGIQQLRKLEGFILERARQAAVYRNELSDVAEVELPADSSVGRNSWHLYVLRLNLERLTITRDEFITELKNRGIGVSVHFIPIPLHPFFRAWARNPSQQCPVALSLYRRIVSLPLYPGLDDRALRRVTEAIKDVVARNSVSRTFAAGAAAV